MDYLNIDYLPTFPNGISINLGKINYFYGKNGVGKSSICKYIKNHSQELTIDNQEILVFDEQFKNTNIVDGMNGIYTIGEENSEILLHIRTKEKEIYDLNIEIKELEELKSKSNEQIQDAFERITDIIWNEKKGFESKFDKRFFKGFNNDKDKFIKQLLRDKNNLLQFKEIDKVENAFELFRKSKPQMLRCIDELDLIDDNKLFAIFKDPIVNHSENQLSAYYSKMQNLDWVSNGRKYINNSDSLQQCPFCQHSLSETFFDEFKAIFDSCYQESLDELTDCCRYLNSNYEKVESTLKLVSDLNSSNIDLRDVNHIILKIKDIALEYLSEEDHNWIKFDYDNKIVKTKQGSFPFDYTNPQWPRQL